MNRMPTLCLLLTVAGLLPAQDVTVPLDHPTIQAGLDAAPVNGTVWVLPGVYVENVVVPGGMRLAAAGGAMPSVVPADPTLPVISFAGLVGPGTSVEGLRIANGRAARGAGIFIDRFQAPVIRGCVIVKNRGSQGAGLYISTPGGSEVEDCVIADNHAYDGGGVFIEDLQTMTWLRRNLITRNVGDYRGGGVHGAGSLYGLLDNRITLNRAYLGAGLYQRNAAEVAVLSNELEANDATAYGGGIFLHSTGLGGEYRGNELSGNTARWYGGGFYAYRCDGTILHDTTIEGNLAIRGAGGYINGCNLTLNGGRVADNDATWRGGGLAVCGSVVGEVEVTRLRFHGNQAIYGGGLYADTAGKVLVTNSVFHGNVAPVGAGVYLRKTSSSVLINNTLVDNRASPGPAGARGVGIWVASRDFCRITNTWMTEHAIAVHAADPQGLVLVSHSAFFDNGVRFNGPVFSFQLVVGLAPWFLDQEFFRTDPRDVGAGRASGAHPDAPDVDIDLLPRGLSRDIGVSET